MKNITNISQNRDLETTKLEMENCNVFEHSENILNISSFN